ncbi:Ectoine hydrolase [Geodia barretti]|uniref:Ectoine hydrolase n=1 Tax=Geodia barretti TaxID=519541 RepID=A0AA35TUL0_GEOBA|nr:Ectoine hydrolase [Geodia barretti]
MNSKSPTSSELETPAPVELAFSRDEYAARIAKTRRAMDERGLDLLVVSDPSNMAWLTGYDGWSFYVHQCVLLALEGDPVWFGRGMDANGAKRTVFMAHDDIVGYADHYVMSTERHPMDYLSEVIAARGWERSRIGVEMDNYYFSAAAYRSLETHLRDATLLDATGLVNWQRLVKSETEIAYMRNAARIVEKMHARIMEVVEPGMRKNELVAEIYHAAITGVEAPAATIPPSCRCSPPASMHRRRTSRGTTSRCGRARRRSSKLRASTNATTARSAARFYLGRPSARERNAESALLEAIEAGLDAARPGNLCEDIHRAFSESLARHGLTKESRCGYSIGLSYPPDWGERTISLRPGDRTVLEPNMTIHFMPALWFEDWGLEITESIRITETSAETLANWPRELQAKA